jgi:hypothetical protein
MQSSFFWNYVPFWVMTYTLAVLTWTCVGRFTLGLFVPEEWNNYIWRAFKLGTDWVVRPVRFVTPRIVPDRPVLLLTAIWLYALRVVASVVMLQAGLAPVVTPGGAS